MSTTLLLVAILAAPASAPVDVNLSDAKISDLWRMHWPRYAARYVPLAEHDYAPCAEYDRDFPSSRKTTVDKVRQSTKVTRRTSTGFIVRDRTSRIPSDDAEAWVRSIPRLDVGEYGYILRAKVLAVLGPTEMVVEDIRLVDAGEIKERKQKLARKLGKRSTARGSSRSVETQIKWAFQNRNKLLEAQNDKDFDRPVKLVGIDTEGLTKGDRFPIHRRGEDDHGVQIAIVRAERRKRSSSTRRTKSRYSTRRRSSALLVAVSGERFRFRELEEPQFVELLEQRGYDKQQFVEMVLRQMRKDSRGAGERVIRSLEAAREKILEAEQEKEEKDSGKRKRSRRRRDRDDDDDDDDNNDSD